MEQLDLARGILDSDRETLATLLTLFEDTTVVAVVTDQVKDLADKGVDKVKDLFSDGDPAELSESSALATRISEAAAKIKESGASDEELGLRLWLHLGNALDLQPQIPLATNALDDAMGALATKYSAEVATIVWTERGQKKSVFSADYWTEYARYKYLPFTKKPVPDLTLDEAVQAMFSRIIAGMIGDDAVDDEAREELGSRALEYIEGLDEERKQKLMDAAGIDSLSRDSALKILASGGALVGTGVATEIAGFSAYILAAKASAIIPLVGGKTLVSLLAVVSNPLFIVPAVLLIFVGVGAKAANKIAQFMAIQVCTVLALKGIAAADRKPVDLCATFRALPEVMPSERVKTYRERKKSDTLWKKASHAALGAGKAVWTTSAKAATLEKYPRLDKYLDAWEVATGKDA